jgi:hypothetical protein
MEKEMGRVVDEGNEDSVVNRGKGVVDYEEAVEDGREVRREAEIKGSGKVR